MSKQSPRVGDHGWRLEFYEKFGGALRAKREAMNLSRDELGRRVGCSGHTLAKIETGAQPCPLHILVAFREVTGISLEETVPRIELKAPERKPERPKRGFWDTL